MHTTIQYSSLRRENSQRCEKWLLKTGIILRSRSGCASFLSHLSPCLVQRLRDDKQGQDEVYRAEQDGSPERCGHGMDSMVVTTKRLDLGERVLDEERAESRTERKANIGHAQEARKYFSA